jgi:hypothetical protein
MLEPSRDRQFFDGSQGSRVHLVLIPENFKARLTEQIPGLRMPEPVLIVLIIETRPFKSSVGELEKIDPADALIVEFPMVRIIDKVTAQSAGLQDAECLRQYSEQNHFRNMLEIRA